MGKLINIDDLDVVAIEIPRKYDVDSFIAGCTEILERIDNLPDTRTKSDWLAVRQGLTSPAIKYYRCSKCNFKI